MAKFCILIALLLPSFGTCAGNHFQCPEYSLLKPCSCLYGAKSNTLRCFGLTNPADLFKVLNRTTDWNFSTLFVHGSTFSYVPTTSLTSNRFRSFIIFNSHLDSLFSEEPDVKNDVESVYLNNVRFTKGFEWKEFRTLKKLKYVNLRYVNISVLKEEDISENFGNELESFSMSNTDTSSLSNGVFASLRNLTEIKMRDSKITYLLRSMFPIPAKLKEIDFTGNLLQSLPDDIFTDMPDLKRVFLEENRLSFISKSVFDTIQHQIEYMGLTRNPLDCNCNFHWTINMKREIVDGMCVLPEDKRGRDIASLNRADFENCEENA